ncbi:MAG TPA: hypothetical protein PLC12_00880 [Candidatus Methanofastidiosa archaeon]|nr:hypothetical protein [Candidatus Methanofastidiosa archaeon]
MPHVEAAPIEIKYFYSSGCSHCKTTSVVMNQIEDHYGDLVNIERINIYSSSGSLIWEEYSQRYSISGAPAVIINEDRKLVGDVKINYDDLVTIIDEMLLGIEVVGDGYYADGLDALSDGDYEGAIDLFNEAKEIYVISENLVKVGLCDQRIEDANNYILAVEKFIEAENYYLSSDYASAKPLYEEIIQIYYDIGNTSRAHISEMRLESCNFQVSYAAATLAFQEDDWESAIVHYEAAKTYTSDKATIDAINDLLSFCQSQVSAQELYLQAESAFENAQYADAKQYYNDASELFNDTDMILYCHDMVDVCDSYILANDTYDYALTLYEGGDYELAKEKFDDAKEIYLSLVEPELASQCDDYMDDCQAKLDEIERQRQLEEEEREHQRFMKMVYVSVAALTIIIFFAGLIIFFRRRGPVTGYEPEDTTEYEEHE